ncbi:MAG: hypothetical protein H5U20_03605 [Rhodobacteraceae bacterium]|nr:hypothetical protein [Paracoccaceae bacterium]
MRIVTDLSVCGRPFRSGRAFSPSLLFSSGQRGAWYDPSDGRRVFTDLAGTLAAAPGEPVARIDDRSGNGNHATQATVAKQPIFGRHPVGGIRNLHPFSQSDTLFSALGSTPPVVQNGAEHLGQSCVAITFTPAMTPGYSGSRAERDAAAAVQVTTDSAYTTSAHISLSRPLVGAERIRVYFTGASAQGEITVTAANSGGLVGGFQRLEVAKTPAVAGPVTLRPFIETAMGADVTIYINRVQLEKGATATAYQETRSLFDVTEAGLRDVFYLAFDGIDDAMQTGVVSWGGATAVSVLAAARRGSDNPGIVLESGPDTNSVAGTFLVAAPIGGDLRDGAMARGASSMRVGRQDNAPGNPGVYSFTADLPGNTFAPRFNGGPMTLTTGTTFGGGNVTDQSLYLGARAGSAVPFQGRFYGAIMVGRALSTSEVAQAEAWLANKAGVTP